MQATGTKAPAAAPPGREPGRLLKALLRLAGGKKKRRKPPKVGGLASLAHTQTGQSLPDVALLLREDGARQVLVNGDAAFWAEAERELAGFALTWCSTQFNDLAAGARNAASLDPAAFDAVVAGGADAGLRFRFSIRETARANPAIPVHWVGEKFEFCRGTLPAPSDADEVEALLTNHFGTFFGIKDPLQFRIEIYHGAEMRRFWRILGPGQSHLIRLGEHFPARRFPVAISTMVCHPDLTRGRHYRLRVCADVFWKGSLTTLHSAHEFRRDPEEHVEFRIAPERVRGGRLVMTVPNYERNLAADRGLEWSAGANRFQRARDPQSFIEEVRAEKPAESMSGFFDCHYRGYGGSFWFAQEPANAAPLAGFISGNHHIQTRRVDRTDMALAPDERARIETLERQGFMLDPHGVPLTGADSVLRFGFDCDAANPPFRDFLVYWFDGAGKLIARMPYAKDRPGTVFADELLDAFDHPGRAEARILFFTPDWLKAGIRRKGFKMLPELVVEHRGSGDRDVTEFQSSWRNLGLAIPDFPHWLTPSHAVVGRTNLLARARQGGGYRSALLVVNGSGRLDYAEAAGTEITVLNHDGAELSCHIEVPAFGWRLVWLDEAIPGLARHLAPTGVGTLLVQSGDADLNAQVVTLGDHGAVSLQHLWGY
ncbi:MAG: hypothetical protein KIT20_03615 [Alphaproteobacteria bacterium]|nr:hypothetical protein [Alphaproteobacteria bacterium]